MRAWLPVAMVALAACAPAVPLDDGTDETSTSTGDDTGSTAVPTDPGDTTSDTTSDTTTSADLPPVDPCPFGAVVLSTQDQVAALAGCTELTGDLSIADAVTSLAPLADLRHIAGALRIGRGEGIPPPMLTSLAGLEALESVGGLAISELDGLTSLQPLAGLTAIPGFLRVSDLPQLASLEGLHNITEVGDTLYVADCPVTDLDGLRGLKRVGSGLDLQNLRIPDLHGLDALTEVGSPGDESVSISLRDNSQLLSLDGLDAVAWHAAIFLDIFNNPKFVDLGALAGASELRGVSIADNDYLLDLTGLESVTTLSTVLELSGNYRLKDISALAGLQSVGYFNLGGDQSFFDLAPLTALAAVGEFEVEATDMLDLGPLPALQQVGDVTVRWNGKLTALSGLAGVTALESLTLAGNGALIDLSGLGAVAKISNDVEIRENAGLAALAGLGALTTIGDRLVVLLNPALPQADAVAWGAAIAVGGGRKIAGNKDAGPPADPCPWEGDFECDQVDHGIGVCVDGSDLEDCVVSD